MRDDESESGGVVRVEHNPAVYLPQHPTDEEHAIVEALRSHSGDAVPMHMLVKVAMRLFGFSGWQERFNRIWRRGSRAAVAIATIAVGGAGTAGAAWLKAHDSNIAAGVAFDEYRKSTDREMQWMRTDIGDLRAALSRLGLVNPAPPPAQNGPGSDTEDIYPDKLSLLGGSSCTYASHLPPP